MNVAMKRLLQQWAVQATDAMLQDAVNRYFQIGPEIYDDYEPSPYDRFEQRLGAWLSNVTSEQDQRTLFKLFANLFFVGRREFECLHRTAFQSVVKCWLIDDAAIDLFSTSFNTELRREIGNTWFCPVTDSLRINGFLKANGLKGHSYRPDWRSLSQFGDPQKIRDYIHQKRIKRIALFEDFVGTGSQAQEAIAFASTLSGSCSVLFCPLIIAEDGLAKLLNLETTHPNLSVRPVITVPKGFRLNGVPTAGEEPHFPVIRKLISTLAKDVPSLKYEPFGYKDSGSLVVLYSNCPDNVTPVIYSGDGWHPLFPRVTR